LADELGGCLCGRRALLGCVCAQLVEVIDVDRRLLRPNGDGDEIAIPRGELFEREQELLALGAALGASEALVGLAIRQVLPLEVLLRLCTRLPGALTGGIDHRLGSLGRDELRIAINGPRQLQQLRPALGCLRIEQPVDAVQPSAGNSGERRLLVRAQAWRALRDRFAHGPLRQPAEGNGLTARADRLRHRADVVRYEHDDGVGRRLLEILE
jgi:hypothetical protein